MKKHLLYGLLALTGLLSSCSKADETVPQTGAPETVSLTATLPADLIASKTRAVPTPPADHKLRCVLEVWDKEMTNLQVRQEVLSDAGAETIKFEFQLETPADYQALLWADYIDATPTTTSVTTPVAYTHYTDKYYTTNDATDGLKAVTIKADAYAWNTVARDAFSAVKPFTKGTGALTDLTATLLRPFTKLTIAEKNATNFGYCQSMTATYKVPTVLNVGTGAISGETEVTFSGAPAGTEITIKGNPGKVLFSDYILATTDGTMGDIALAFTPTSDSHKRLKAVTIPAGIPAKRNYCVNAVGNLIVAEDEPSSSVTMTVDVNAAWAGTEDVELLAIMRFTIDLTDFPTDMTYKMPFATTGTTGAYTLTVDWGDGGTKETIPANTDLTNAIAHTYADAKAYTITIASTETDASKVQMPDFRPGKYYISYNNTVNAEKLKSMDTPLLHTGITNFSDCFKSCANLTSIPEGLFAANVKVTEFYNCFLGCKSLVSIPEQLFALNVDATIFYNCFSNCTNLGSIPNQLFAANVEATNFGYCFQYCPNLVSIPEQLFTANVEATNFSCCFSGCTNLGSIPEQLFTANVEATDFSFCFSGCTNLGSIPEQLFTANVDATNFSNCFSSCTHVKLNSNIFCKESEAKTTRFAGKEMDFSGCFNSCGSELQTSEGSTAPELWSYTMTSSQKAGCFYQVTKVSNYTSIPAAWKNL